MLQFDEGRLVRELSDLPSRARVAFSAASATRQLGSYERFDSGSTTRARPREIVCELWSALRDGAVDETGWSSKLDEVSCLLPDTTENWALGHSLAEDAISSLSYAIRCFLRADSQEAAWAARRGYEAADQATIRLLGIQPGDQCNEEIILSHEIVQRELFRQQRDLISVRDGLLEEVERRSFRETLLSSKEVEVLFAASRDQ